MQTLSNTDAAYLAGIIDGEGSISLNKGQLVLVIDSTDLELLEWVKDRCGGFILKKKKYKDHHSQAWIWRVKSLKALSVLRQIAPFLVIKRKQHRANLAIQEYQICTPRNGYYTDQIKQRKEAFIEEFFGR